MKRYTTFNDEIIKKTMNEFFGGGFQTFTDEDRPDWDEYANKEFKMAIAAMSEYTESMAVYYTKSDDGHVNIYGVVISFTASIKDVMDTKYTSIPTYVFITDRMSYVPVILKSGVAIYDIFIKFGPNSLNLNIKEHKKKAQVDPNTLAEIERLNSLLSPLVQNNEA